MTHRNGNKTSARNLMSLTGMPYQRCLTAVEVLRQIPQGFGLGDLDIVVAGNGSRHTVLHLPDDDDLSYRSLFTAPYGPLHEDAELVVIAGEHPVVLARLDGEHWGTLPTGASLWLDFYLGHESLRPRGTWQLPARTLRRALMNESDTATTVAAEQARAADSFPTSFAEGDQPHAAYISPRLAAVRPSYATAGPGFDWAHLYFADLDMVYPSDETDHRLAECHDANCGWLHNWPTADPAHTQMIIPAPLLDAYQKLWVALGFDDDDLNNESYLLYDVAENGSAWYGLDLPDLSSIWMRVDRDGISPTGTDELLSGPALS